MERRRIYLDYAATAPMRPEVWQAMEDALSACFNPASTHAFGRDAHERLETARDDLAASLGSRRSELYFTGGGTAATNTAILGFARANEDAAPRILVSSIEHSAGVEASRQAAREGAETHAIPVRACGTVDVDALEQLLAAGEGRPTLVSVMWANNEVGTVEPVERVAELTRSYGALFHTDAVQAVGKVEVSLERVPADLLTATAHKLGGPGGIGLLVCREGCRLAPIMYGGSQEKSLWPGTQNPVAAVGFAAAVRLSLEEREEHTHRWVAFRERLAGVLTERLPGIRIHGADAAKRLPNILNVGIVGCDQGALLVSLDLEGIAVSGGSACASGTGTGSHVLDAMGAADDETYAAIRFSFGHETSEADIDAAADATVRCVDRVMAATV